MRVLSSQPSLGNPIPNFPYSETFRHQWEFYKNRRRDIAFQAPTSSGKTAAFLYSFINDYINGERGKLLYMVPTRLLAQSQEEGIRETLKRYDIPHTILEGGYTYAELAKQLWANDFIISSPDIIYSIFLRRRKTQHIGAEFEEFARELKTVVLDEIHLFSTYILYNLQTMLNIFRHFNPNIHIYLLSATLDLGKAFDLSKYYRIDGVSCTKPVEVRAVELNYYDPENVVKFLKGLPSLNNTVYVANSAHRAYWLRKDYFPDAAILLGKNHQTEEERRENLRRCREGVFTFATSPFRQGVDIALDRVITEDVENRQDMIQTFGRTGRHKPGEFIVLTQNSKVLKTFNQQKEVSRKEFEAIISVLYEPKYFPALTKQMQAMWYKLYEITLLKEQIKPVITPEMETAYEEFKEFLPKPLSFRDALPQVKYGENGSIDIFEILRLDEAKKFLTPVDTSEQAYYVAELNDGGRYKRLEYGKWLKPKDVHLELVEAKRYNGSWFSLTLKVPYVDWDCCFTVNAVAEKNDRPDWYRAYTTYGNIVKRPHRYISFRPVVFFEV